MKEGGACKETVLPAALKGFGKGREVKVDCQLKLMKLHTCSACASVNPKFGVKCASMLGLPPGLGLGTDPLTTSGHFGVQTAEVVAKGQTGGANMPPVHMVRPNRVKVPKQVSPGIF